MRLAEAFLARFAAEEGKRFTRFDPDAVALLRAHRWPGNVRELENAIRTAVVLHDGEAVSAAMLPVTVHGGAAPSVAPPAPRAPDPARRIRPLAEVEREAIEEAIRLCGGNVPKAAAFLGVSPSTLYRKREAWAQRG
jgi:two-component system repressor protein LuxO